MPAVIMLIAIALLFVGGFQVQPTQAQSSLSDGQGNPVIMGSYVDDVDDDVDDDVVGIDDEDGNDNDDGDDDDEDGNDDDDDGDDDDDDGDDDD